MNDDVSVIETTDGGTVRGYELDFESEVDGWSEYTLEDGTTIRLTYQVKHVYALIDDRGNPLVDNNGSPRLYVDANAVVKTIVSDEDDEIGMITQSIKQGWIDAMNGEIYPVSTLWDDLDADE